MPILRLSHLPHLTAGVVCGLWVHASLSAQDLDCPPGNPVVQASPVPASDSLCRPPDFPCAAVPAPTGIYVRGWQQAMIGSAARQQSMISRREWFSGGKQLGPDGIQHLNAIAYSPNCSQGIVIEAEPVVIAPRQTYQEALAANTELNEQRRQIVVAGLQERGWPDADQMVTVSNVTRVGVRGIEAPMIYSRGFQNRNRGNQGNNGNNSSGGFGGGSGSSGSFGGGGFY